MHYPVSYTHLVEANMKLATRFGKAKGKAEKERSADALAQVGLSGYERRKEMCIRDRCGSGRVDPLPSSVTGGVVVTAGIK